jgi:hypothetical protein
MSAPDPTVHTDAAPRFDLRAALACAGAALLAGVVYLNALHNPFVYDDYLTVVANPSIQNVRDVPAIVRHDITRPLTNVSYAIDRAIWGTGAFGFHVTSVLLHMLNVVLLFLLAWQLARNRLVAFAAAALFAVHPMMTEAVGYISGRAEVLCATWFLLAVLCGRWWLRADGKRGAMATAGFWVAGLATKGIAAMFPFVLLCEDLLVVPLRKGERWRRLLTVHLPLMGTALVAGLVRLVVLTRVEYPGQATIHWPDVLIGLDVVRRYLGLMVNATGQSIFHEVARVGGVLDPRALLAIGTVGLMAAVAWKIRRVHGLASLGIFWFLLLLVPSTALTVFDQGEPMAEHGVYLASCGLFLAAGEGTGWLHESVARRGARARLLVPIVLTLVLASFGGETLMRNAVWASPVTLWREAVELAPTHYRPRLLLGEALQDAGRRAEAAEQFRTAVRLRPSDPTGRVKLGQLLGDMGHAQEARQEFLEALRLDPQNVSARRLLALLDQIESRPGSDAFRH